MKSSKKFLIALNMIAAVAVISVAAKLLIVPSLAKYLYKDQYEQLMFQCDDVMRDHFIAKSRVEATPSKETIKTLQSAEVSLLTCHDYDKLRKKLLILGVSEAELESMGLDMMEKNATDVRQFVETHEIRY